MSKIKNFMKITLIAPALFANLVWAEVICPEARVEYIYPTAEKTIVKLVGLDTHVVAMNDDPAFAVKISDLNQAKSQGYPVRLTFPDGYPQDCLSNDNTVAAISVEIVH